MHGGKRLDDGLNPLAKARTGQILVDHFGFGLLALRYLPYGAQLQQQMPQYRGHGQCGARMRHPDAIDDIEGFDLLRQRRLTRTANSALAQR